jgi:drug/metabolite transporter (DMT)-like permease
VVERITIPYPGELAAATAAAIWAGTSVFYGQVGRQVSPLVLNLSKGLWAIAYILVTLLITGQSWQMPSRASGLLSLSGLVGITLGDTLFFGALNRIGARQTLLINTLSPAATAILADRFLGERLAAINYGGIATPPVPAVISLEVILWHGSGHGDRFRPSQCRRFSIVSAGPGPRDDRS